MTVSSDVHESLHPGLIYKQTNYSLPKKEGVSNGTGGKVAPDDEEGSPNIDRPGNTKPQTTWTATALPC